MLFIFNGTFNQIGYGLPQDIIKANTTTDFKKDLDDFIIHSIICIFLYTLR